MSMSKKVDQQKILALNDGSTDKYGGMFFLQHGNMFTIFHN